MTFSNLLRGINSISRTSNKREAFVRNFSSAKNRLSKQDSFDYVVVGAGSAGCVLANRLTEDQNSVALLEAGMSDVGKWDSWKIQMPAALTFNLGDDKYNWDYWTVPQKHMNGRSLHCPRGKTLGGSSSLNAMVYVRGNALDFERWNEEGAPGWSYADVLPYFKKAQSHSEGPSDYRGGDGPLEVQTIEKGYCHELFDAFVNAGVQAGYPETKDPNGYMQEGFGLMDMTIGKDGRRWNTANAYLRPAMNRKNLTLKTESKFKKLIFDENNKTKAIGLEYIDSSGAMKKIFANKEVILTMGAIGSPHALLLSGIGPEEQLKEHAIDVVVNQPLVGENLQDHSEVYLQYFCKKPVSLYPVGGWKYPHKKVAVGLEWFANGTGPCASNQFESGGFIRTRAGTQHPDLQYHFIPGCVVGQMEFLPHHGFQVHVGTCRPKSRGTVKLQSADPNKALLIDPNYYAEEDDLVRMRDGLRLTLEIINQKAFDDYRGDLLEPGPHIDINDDAQVDEWTKNMSHSSYHVSCTNAMGKVVDENGKVYGTEGLRVVDSSIMPSLTSGNLNAPTIMMAEKLADVIRGKPTLEPIDAPYFIAENWETQQR